MQPALAVSALRKTFRRRVRQPGLSGLLRSIVAPAYQEYEALRGLDFTLEAGQSLALIGPNGAGKSTTIKLLTGILHPTSGEARVLGLLPWRERRLLSLNIATVFGQRSQLWYDLPAADSFELLACIYELRRADYLTRRAELVRRFQLEPLLATPVRKLSLGQRTRCEIAGALLHRPRVLFLDEPTIGLDVLAKQEIRSLVRELNRDEGVTVLLTSHDAGDIEQLCEQMLLIHQGSLICHDRVSVIARRCLRHKLVDVQLQRPLARPLALEFATLLEQRPLGLKLALDLTRGQLGQLLSQLTAALPIADITIEDPPLEDVIGALYRDLPDAHAEQSA